MRYFHYIGAMTRSHYLVIYPKDVTDDEKSGKWMRLADRFGEPAPHAADVTSFKAPIRFLREQKAVELRCKGAALKLVRKYHPDSKEIEKNWPSL